MGEQVVQLHVCWSAGWDVNMLSVVLETCLSHQLAAGHWKEVLKAQENISSYS